MFFRHHGHDHGRGRGFGPRGGGFGRGGFEMRRGAGGEERGGGRRRVFDSGELRLVLLKLIGDQPRHGYDLIREVESLSGGAYVPSPGVVYPTLTLLADMGHIDESKAEGARKLFAVTDEGRAHLEEKAAEIAALFERLAELGARRERTEGGPVRRAMVNLHMAVRGAVHDKSDDILHDIAAILDEAAQKIERL